MPGLQAMDLFTQPSYGEEGVPQAIMQAMACALPVVTRTKSGVAELLIANDAKRFWRPPYLGHRGWIAVVLDAKPDWSLVSDLVEQGYRLVATQKLVAQLDAAAQRGRSTRRR